tara:strand:+ start:9982 stop:10920 length:939 start_codon:yes stop_codon:yes gene_type:complete
MSTLIGRQDIGLFDNGSFESGTITNFTGAGGYISTEDPKRGKYHWESKSRSNRNFSQYVPVDSSKRYVFSISCKTLERSTSNLLGRHYIGFTCYDEDKNFIRLEHCGGVGNTFLSRDLNPGDAYMYFQSSSGWYTGADVTNQRNYFRNIGLYPPTHPKYSAPHRYTRVGTRGGSVGGSQIQYRSMVQTNQGDWQVELCDTADNPRNWTYNEPYATPAGTPVHKGTAGGTYNYAFGRRQYTDANWTTYQLFVEGPERRNSGRYFRYDVKYIRFMILWNYALSSGGGSMPYPRGALDDIILIEENTNRSYNFIY